VKVAFCLLLAVKAGAGGTYLKGMAAVLSVTSALGKHPLPVM